MTGDENSAADIFFSLSIEFSHKLTVKIQPVVTSWKKNTIRKYFPYNKETVMGQKKFVWRIQVRATSG